jgi:hypothetical protein
VTALHSIMRESRSIYNHTFVHYSLLKVAPMERNENSHRTSREHFSGLDTLDVGFRPNTESTSRPRFSVALSLGNMSKLLAALFALRASQDILISLNPHPISFQNDTSTACADANVSIFSRRRGVHRVRAVFQPPGHVYG